MRIAAVVKSLALLVMGSVAMLAPPAAHAGVSGTFYETACYEENPAGPMCPTSRSGSFFFSGPLPAALAQFSSPDNSGTYSFSQSDVAPTPVITGNTDFQFAWGNGEFHAPASPDRCFNSSFVDFCRWNITWAASAAGFSIRVDFIGDLNANIDIGDFGGMIGSDGTIQGCGEFAECFITGYWLSSVPEPSSLAVLATSLLGVLLVMARRRARI